MLEVVHRLLRGHEHGREVLAVFRKLVARNCELELQLHELKSSRNKGEGGDNRAALPIAGFKKLYDIEQRIRDLDDEQRLQTRQQESAPVYESLLHWCRV